MTRHTNHRRNRSRNATTSNEFFHPLEPRQLFAAGGALDTSFSADGLATVDFGPGITVSSRDVAVQADGKTVVVGAASNGDIALARFNLDGSLDTTFGANRTGKVLTHVGLSDLPCAADAVAILPSGSIVVAGQARFDRPEYGFDIHSMVLVRFNADGTPATYNRVEQTKFGSSIMAEAKDLAVQSDGKIVVAGTVLNGNYANMFVARYHSNFARDNSFDGDGVKFIPYSGDTVGRAVTIDYTGTRSTNPRFGSIVVAGTKQEGTAYAGFVVARLKPSGGFDNTFDGDGRAMMYIGGAATDASGVVMQPDGKIVIAGTATYNAPRLDNKFALARLMPNGAPDKTFAGQNSGWTTTDLFGDDRASDVIQSFDGKLLVGGTTNGQFGVIQYNANGTIDRGFGTNGYRVTKFASDTGVARLASGPGRRFVATGGRAFATARYLDANANLVTLATFQTKAYEQGSKATSFIVGRTERLPYATRVQLSMFGTAFRNVDYTLDGVTIPPASVGLPYVEIPANQTFVVVTYKPIDDTVREPSETTTFSIVPHASYELSASTSATLTIIDNDRPLPPPPPPPGGGIRRTALRAPSASASRPSATRPTPTFSQRLISELL